jgi:hypothetical protein
MDVPYRGKPVDRSINPAIKFHIRRTAATERGSRIRVMLRLRPANSNGQQQHSQQTNCARGPEEYRHDRQ